MALDIDKVFGGHQRALSVYSKRSQTLASNIANADTPHYKARDVDFRSVLANTTKPQAPVMTKTHRSHITQTTQMGDSSGELLYRVPIQPSLDGNTVDAQTEQAAFAENSIRYQATLQFISGKIRGIRMAIVGGEG
ncbi:MAG: flagellar basal body rod protein FlgB [Pseudomonadota bacterium]|nr:flagellar basal body rod protein FlgB [Pseudomonadota bacterium]